MKKAISLLLASALVLSLAACGSNGNSGNSGTSANGNTSAPNNGQQVNTDAEVMMIGTTISSTTPHGRAFLEFERLVEERSEGQIDVQLYFDGTMGDARQLCESIQLHSLQGGMGDGASTSNFDKNFFATDLPFLFLSPEASYEELDGELGDMLRASAEAHGMRILGFWDGGFRDISNSVRPVSSPADLAGLKIRVMEAPLYLSVWEAWGANPTPMAFSEVYTALQQRTVDGQDNGPVLTYNNKFYEVLDYYTSMDYALTISPFMVDIPWFDSLDADLQQIIIDTEAECRALERKYQQEQAAEALVAMEEAGVEIIYLNNDQKKEFQEVALTVWDVVEADMSPEIYNKCLEIAGK